MLKAKKPKSTKQMDDAIKEVMKEDSSPFYFKVPQRLYWKLEEHLTRESKIRNIKYTKRKWLIEQLESLPDPSDK